MAIFSGQSVISRVYRSSFGNGTGSHGTSTEVVLKKYQVPGTVPSGKPPKSEPYRTVPCRTMQWKSAITLMIIEQRIVYCALHLRFRRSKAVFYSELSSVPEPTRRESCGSMCKALFKGVVTNRHCSVNSKQT